MFGSGSSGGNWQGNPLGAQLQVVIRKHSASLQSAAARTCPQPAAPNVSKLCWLALV